MATLREVDHVRQGAGEPARRWFSSADLDLIVWLDPTGRPTGFQLCYDKPRDEHALTWTSQDGFTHHAVDDGDDVGVAHKTSPVLVRDGVFDLALVRREFDEASAHLPADIAAFVTDTLRRHPDAPDASGPA